MREERDHEIWKRYQDLIYNYGYCKEIAKFSEFNNFYDVQKLTWVGKLSYMGMRIKFEK